jgi:hypothetical protein
MTFRERIRPWLAASIASAALLTPAAAFAIDFMSGGFRFDIQDGSGFTSDGGELSDGTSDAYDGCYYLDVAGMRYAAATPGTTSLGGRQVELPPTRIGTLDVSRLIYVPEANGWARYVDVVSNPGATDVMTTVEISGNLGSDGSTVLVATSSGDASFTPLDRWFTTDDTDASGDPSLGHVVQGTSPLVAPRTASLSGDNLEWIFDVTVPASGRIAIVTFAIQASNRAAARTEAERLVEMPEDAFIGLDAYAGEIVNFESNSMGPCMGLAEGAMCTNARSTAGTCRAGVCCTGCWDGMRCVGGRTGTACGVGGAACASCADGDDCSSDVCTAGVCSNPNAPAGTVCNDNLYCTRTDRCNATRNCVGTGDACDDSSACTIDVCTEATDSCTNTVTADRCIIGGECVANGAIHPAYPCLTCDPMRSSTDWSTRTAGTVCGAASCTGGRLLPEATCSAAGACTRPAPMLCAAGYCASGTSCQMMCEEGRCPGATFCAPSGVCETKRANGSTCSSDVVCDSAHCIDGVCCETTCDGTCLSCALRGTEGTCSPVPENTDPDNECPGGFCSGSGRCAVGDGGTLLDAGAPDAGSRDAGPVDALVTFDAYFEVPDASLPTTRTGCQGCSAAGGQSDKAMWLLGLLGVVTLVRRRRAR